LWSAAALKTSGSEIIRRGFHDCPRFTLLRLIPLRETQPRSCKIMTLPS
jgi:hypothetical protein